MRCAYKGLGTRLSTYVPTGNQPSTAMERSAKWRVCCQHKSHCVHIYWPRSSREHLNKVHKGDGAISGITIYPQGLLKYCLSSPELARLAGETEQMLNITKTRARKHHQHSFAKTTREEQAVRKLKSVVLNQTPSLCQRRKIVQS